MMMGKSLTRSAVLAAIGLLLAVAVLTPAQAQTSDKDYATGRVIFSFPPDLTGGLQPRAGVIRDSAGNLYGTTSEGGDLRHPSPQAYCGMGCGTVFKVDKTGKETVLHAFSGQLYDFDGSYPVAGLVMDSSGNLFGNTYAGGDYSDLFPVGVIFKIDPTGKETILYQFNINNGDATYPTATLTPDGQGNLYGTLSINGPGPAGSIFKIDAQGNYSQIYVFQGGSDGDYPYRSRMLVDASGNLYGVTLYGGSPCDPNNNSGCGVVFELSPNGVEKVLYAFQGGRDGAHPVGDMAWDAAGNLIGVTYNGGTNDTGVVFRVSKTGHETVLYSFGPGLDGQPESGVTVDASGNIYGTTRMGGSYHQGSVFKFDRHGVVTTLKSFNGGSKGGRPWGQLLLDSGVLYGTTIDGGEWGTGTIYQIELP
jgi:uncharacterized repeat protein (TIGR03803 family)